MFSWQQKKLPQRQREPCLAPTRRMRFKISLLSTMSILKKKPVTAMRHTLQTLKDGTPAHDDVLAMQASIDSSTPIATADTSSMVKRTTLRAVSPFSSSSMPLTPQRSNNQHHPNYLTSPVFSNAYITSSSSSSSPGMLMWPFDETSSNAKEQMSKKQAVDATSSASTPTLDLLELPFFTEASPIIAMQQDSKSQQTNKALSPIRCTLPSPDIGNTTSNVQIPSSPTPALQHSANASALWIANDECTKTSTSSKSKLLSFSNKKSNMMSNPRTPLSPLALANNTKKQSVTNALHASLANKSNVPAKNTFKAPAPISKRKRNGNSSNDSSKISPTYNIENYFIKSKAASINEGTAKKENTTTTTTSSLAIHCKRPHSALHHHYSAQPHLNRQQKGCRWFLPSTQHQAISITATTTTTRYTTISSPQLGLNEQVMRKRTRVSVHTNGGIHKPRYAERSLSESAVNHIGACHSSAPHTPPSTRRCSSPSNAIESTKMLRSQEQSSSTTSQTIVHGSDSFMSPMSRRIIAAAGMRRFGETMPMDMLKSNLVNPFL
ncbi:hypothetical protein BDF22DRAFT_739495 [Syncephalis plumigaleata]|nr:hypothetical protein BDF22DRAFT_739495 [Syncephalis plumigaleata]